MNRWLIGLLIVSFAFNFAFIGGYVYHRWMGQQPPPPVRAFNSERREALRERLDELRSNGREYVDGFQRARFEFIDTLRDSIFNEELAQQRLEASLQRHMEMERCIGRDYIELRKELSPEEAARFFEHMQHMQPEMGGPNAPNPDHPRCPDRSYPRGSRRPGMERP